MHQGEPSLRHPEHLSPSTSLRTELSPSPQPPAFLHSEETLAELRLLPRPLHVRVAGGSGYKPLPRSPVLHPTVGGVCPTTNDLRAGMRVRTSQMHAKERRMHITEAITTAARMGWRTRLVAAVLLIGPLPLTGDLELFALNAAGLVLGALVLRQLIRPTTPTTTQRRTR